MNWPADISACRRYATPSEAKYEQVKAVYRFWLR